MGTSDYILCDTDEENAKLADCNKHKDKISSKSCYWTQFIAGFSSKYFLSLKFISVFHSSPINSKSKFLWYYVIYKTYSWNF